MSDDLIKGLTQTIADLRALIVQQNEMTRQHISATIAGNAHETAMVKGQLIELIKTLKTMLDAIK